MHETIEYSGETTLVSRLGYALAGRLVCNILKFSWYL